MAKIEYNIELKSDAEPGTGFGTELINKLVPRDSKGRIIIPASHIKGLMRDNLNTIADDLNSKELSLLIKKVFGTPGGIKENNEGILYLSDAKSDVSASIFISRTSLNEYGVAKDTSLRTTEAIPVGTIFKGSVHIQDSFATENFELIKLALLSLNAIGGSRNRGCGQCKVTIKGVIETPGNTLKSIIALLSVEKKKEVKNNQVFNIVNVDVDKKPVFFKLTFSAEGPICLPETPIVGNNTIVSGIAISASAVQGAILHRINKIDKNVADYCFTSVNFRTWPLLPVIDNATGLPIRAPLSHRSNKLNDIFSDDIIHNKQINDELLKSVDGVLIQTKDGVSFIKAVDISRVISAHGVHKELHADNDNKIENEKNERNLFTIESIAPMTFSGIISMPENAAVLLLESIKTNNFFQFGKAKGIKGGGTLSAEKLVFSDFIKQEALSNEFKDRVFVVQSPVLIPENEKISSSKETFCKLINESGWGKAADAMCNISMIFGWNSHGKGVNNAFQMRRLSAQKIITPGSVFILEKPIDNLEEKLLRGIGKGKERGFGAVLPHVGIADRKYHVEIEPEIIKSKSKEGEIGFNFWVKSNSSGLSASQINFFRNKLLTSKETGLKFLHEVKDNRTKKVWDRWKIVRMELIECINCDYETAKKAVKVWQDLVVAKEI